MEQTENFSDANRKPIYDAMRAILGRGFHQSEVERIDRAIDVALGGQAPVEAAHRLGSLSEAFESGGRGPGAVSSGRGDPGGVSYGIYQLASKTGALEAFLANEGSVWREELAKAQPGRRAFAVIWRRIAEREPDTFAAAQHAFIARTHYAPAVRAVRDKTGLDLDARHAAVRDAVWSVAVQHGRAARILCDAVARADGGAPRAATGYDRALIAAIYAMRCDYVLGVASRASGSARRTLESIVRNRYPAERTAALAMLDGG